MCQFKFRYFRTHLLFQSAVIICWGILLDSWNCLQFDIVIAISSNLWVLLNCHSGHLIFQNCDKWFESMASAAKNPSKRWVITLENAFCKSKKAINSSSCRTASLTKKSSCAAWPPLTNAMLNHSSTYLLILFFREVII